MKLFVKLLLACIICAWGLFAPTTVYGQSITLREKISFSANKISVADALEKLSKKVGLTFSYNPDQISSSKIVNVDFKNRMLLEVLDGILGPSQFRFQLSGKQIVIFKNKSIQASSALEQEHSDIRTPRVDTVFVPIKIAVHDTLILLDTIKKVDTVKIEVIKPSNSDIISTSGYQALSYDIGFSLSYMLPQVHYATSDELSSKLGDYKKYNSKMLLSKSIGIEGRVTRNSITAIAGISFTSFVKKLDYEYVDTQGGYFRKDTLDSYYTVKGADTTWFYLEDSTYIPIDSRAYKYQLNNHLRYLEIPLTIAYNLEYRKMKIYARGGIMPGFLINTNGYSIKLDDQGTISAKNIEHKRFVLSYIVAAGVQMPIQTKMTLSTSLFYRSHFSSVYTSFPIKTRYSAFGINATLVYKIEQSKKR